MAPRTAPDVPPLRARTIAKPRSPTYAGVAVAASAGASAKHRSHGSWVTLSVVIERVLRVANSFAEAEVFDRQDLARMTVEERIASVERLRRIWFGDALLQSRMDRVLGLAEH